jgi:hypothetical protein
MRIYVPQNLKCHTGLEAVSGDYRTGHRISQQECRTCRNTESKDLFSFRQPIPSLVRGILMTWFRTTTLSRAWPSQQVIK